MEIYNASNLAVIRHLSALSTGHSRFFYGFGRGMRHTMAGRTCFKAVVYKELQQILGHSDVKTELAGFVHSQTGFEDSL